jgi:hypothetical protein
VVGRRAARLHPQIGARAGCCATPAGVDSIQRASGRCSHVMGHAAESRRETSAWTSDTDRDVRY